MKKFGIIANLSKNNVYEISNSISEMFKNYNISLYSYQDLKSDNIKQIEHKELLEKVDIIISLGGDGTLLSSAREIIEYNKLVLPVNNGTLGFLSEIKPTELKDILEDVINENYSVEKRITLYVKTIREKLSSVIKNVAINEVLISRRVFDKMLRFNVFIDDYRVARFNADGLIISTPTGSTGHSLSAGGPVLHPNLACLIMTPFCAHTLTARPLIIPEKSVVKVEFEKTDQDIIVSYDGQVSFEICSDSSVSVTKSIYKLNLVRKYIHSFYEVLREKLLWLEK